MFALSIFLLWLSQLLISAQAQVGPQALQLPACIKACDPAAIASVNCTNADQYCHCVRQAGILYNITACADTTCTNPSASLFTFTTLFGEVCAPFNITVTILGSNASANGTTVVPPTLTSSPTVYTGGAGLMAVARDAVFMSCFIATLSLYTLY